MKSLWHDCAWAITYQVLDIFAPCLREEERREAFAEVYAVVKAGLEDYEVKAARRLSRLAPSRN